MVPWQKRVEGLFSDFVKHIETTYGIDKKVTNRSATMDQFTSFNDVNLTEISLGLERSNLMPRNVSGREETTGLCKETRAEPCPQRSETKRIHAKWASGTSRVYGFSSALSSWLHCQSPSESLQVTRNYYAKLTSSTMSQTNSLL
jgi:hypothetical protein